jgi:putative oxidoreductase
MKQNLALQPKHNRITAFFTLRRQLIIEIIAALFILLFVYTAISKLSDASKFQNVLSKSPLIGSLASYISLGLPILELVVTGLLFLPKTRWLGLYSSLVLMAGFTCYLGYMIYFTPNLPCSCGGVLSQMTWREHLVFNSVFNVLALWGVILSRKERV